MHRNISLTITDICQKEKIDYKSPHLLYADAGRLGEICLELSSFSDEIRGICERHKINGDNKFLQQDREKIAEIEHHLRNIAQRILIEKKDD